MIRYLAGLLLLSACVPPMIRSAAPIVPGCYRFDRAYFRTGVEDEAGAFVGIDSTSLVHLTPISKLVPVKAEDEGRRRQFVLRLPELNLLSEDEEAYGTHSHWSFIRADSIRISWWSGLSGPAFRLAVRGDTLVGVQSFGHDIASGSSWDGETLVFHFDDPIWEPAHAVRVSCPQRLSVP